ncbi:MAG: ABC transporter ATP-binding protein [Propioniciclava sp.]
MNLSLISGEFTVLFGASGSGKSTLLNLFAGLDVPSHGQLEVLTTNLSTLTHAARTKFHLHNIGLVFQEHNLIPQFTAVENVEILLRARGADAPHRHAMAALEAVGLTEQAHRRPAEMSGGQRQRVGVARAIAGDRPLVLCDEPTGSLDSQNSTALFAILKRMAEEQGIAVLVATHDAGALDYAHVRRDITDGAISPASEVSTYAD